MGSGMYVNIASPEETAAAMRQSMAQESAGKGSAPTEVASGSPPAGFASALLQKSLVDPLLWPALGPTCKVLTRRNIRR